MDQSLLATIWQSPELPALLQILNARWEEEQQRRHAFWADVDENRKAEFITGEIIYHSPVIGRHWRVSTNLCTELLPYVKRNELGKVGYEKVMIRLTRNDYEPDICFWKKEKAQSFGLTQSAFPAPDFIVEILSDSTANRDRGIKLQDYALHGVGEYWIIDADACTIEQYLLDSNAYVLAQKLNSGSILSVGVEGFSMSLDDIFHYEEK